MGNLLKSFFAHLAILHGLTEYISNYIICFYTNKQQQQEKTERKAGMITRQSLERWPKLYLYMQNSPQ